MKFFTSFFVIVMAVCMIGMVGCTFDDESTPWIGGETGSTGSSGDTGTTGDTGDTGDTGTTGDTGSASLVGIWVTPVYTFVLPTGTFYNINTLTYTESERVLSVMTYWDNPPTYPLWEWKMTSDYTVGDEITNASDETVTEMDLTSFALEMTILDVGAGTQDGFNAPPGTCGMMDWVNATAKDITGIASCDPPSPAESDTLLLVFQMPDATTLIMGEDPVGSERPTDLGDLIYTKQ